VPIHLACIGAVGGVAYLAALRAWFPATFGDLRAALRRIVPARVMAAGAGRLSALRPAGRRV
jgi:hypothetical protein